MAIRKEKRKARKGAVAIAPVEQAVRSVAEERRMIGKPLAEAPDAELFTEDRLGLPEVKKARTLRIDRILDPKDGSVAVAPIQRHRPGIKKTVAKVQPPAAVKKDL